MAQKTNQPKGFWHELKRRKVFNVISVYAGAAFIILQVVSLVKDPLRLPEWTVALTIVLLCIGFVIAAIVAWIYEITPSGMKVTKPEKARRHSEPATAKHSAFTLTSAETSKGWKIATYASMLVILALSGLNVYQFIYLKDPMKRLQSSGDKISVAIMPFRNLSNDSSLYFLQEGIRDNVTNELYNYQDELVVRQPEVVSGILESSGVTKNAAILPEIAGEISRKIDADLYVSGSIHKSGSGLRFNAQVVDAKSGKVIKSLKIEGLNSDKETIILMDSLARSVRNFLVMFTLFDFKKLPDSEKWITTGSLDAFRCYIDGLEAFRQRNYVIARKHLRMAIDRDSNFYMAMNLLTHAYGNSQKWDSAKFWCRKVYNKKEKLTKLNQLYVRVAYSEYFERPYEVIKVIEQILEIDNQTPAPLYEIGWAYNNLKQYENAIPYLIKSIELYQKWGMKPWWVFNYTDLGYAYHETRQYKKEKKLYELANKDFPNDPALIRRQIILAFSLGQIEEANLYIENYQSIQRQNSISDANLAANLANIYVESEMYEKAEEYYRKAITLEPDKTGRKNTFANFLVKYDKNINEGIQLAEKVLAINPENYNSLWVKGVGLYKQGKYKESLELLEKSWKLRRELAVYDHEAWLQLEVVRKAAEERGMQ